MSLTVSHRLPGRLRLDIADIRFQPVLAYKLQCALEQIPGIQAVQCNASSGRALIRYAENSLSEEQVLDQVRGLLSTRSAHAVWEEIAATTELESRASSEIAEATSTTRPEPAHSTRRSAAAANPYRISAIASASAFGILSIKRLLVGRSALAIAPGPFYAAAGLTLAAGYPRLRRGLEGRFRQSPVKPDLLLGLAALGLAVLRENLVALSAITLLNIAMYRRHSVLSTETSYHDEELEQHGQRMGKVGLWLTPLALLLTQSPLRALGVLMAANPRPAQLAHQYAWAKAEQLACQKQLPMPSRGDLAALAGARTIVFADGASLNEEGQEFQVRVLKEGLDEDKAMAIAASLIQHEQDHPWRASLLTACSRYGRTVRTPFNVEAVKDGVQGVLNGHETLFGSKEFLKQLDIDPAPVLLEERRMRKDGFKTQILVQDGKLLALIGRKQQLNSSWQGRIKGWEQQGFTVHCLQTEEHIACPLQMMSTHELSALLAERKPVLLIGEHNLSIDSPHLVTMAAAELSKLDQLLSYSAEVKQQINRDISLVKKWNTIGAGLAVALPIGVPLINLMAEAIASVLMIRHQFRRPKLKPQLPNPYVLEHPFHAMDVKQAMKLAGGSLTGLTQEEAAKRLKQYGANVLDAPPRVHPLQIFVRQMKDFPTLILLGAAGLSLFMGETLSAVCIAGILFANAWIGTWQEVRSSSVLQALKNEEEPQARALRGGIETRIPISELVPGDLVLLEAGDFIPADLRIVQASNLEVNEAILTGESIPAHKHANRLASETPIADRSNLVYMGTAVSRGRAQAIVVAAGRHTQIGTLQSLLDKGAEPPTPLQSRVTQLGKYFVSGALLAGGIVAAAGLIRGIPPVQLLLSAVTLAASAIPEGLPLTITIALTAGVMRMAKRKTVVRKLASLESLGRVTVICSDKTGTLTRNEMTVKELATTTRRIGVTGDGYRLEGEFYPIDSQVDPNAAALDSDAKQLLRIGLLCNNASLEQQEENFKMMGDPTEKAILTVGMKAGIDKEVWHRHREIPFDSSTGSMSVVCEETELGEHCLLLTKGSPESILRKCDRYLSDGEVKPLTDEIHKQIEQENMRMAQQALRVLGFAYRPIEQDEDVQHAADDGLIYVGLMGMIDPPREDVRSSIEEARELGIKPVMITGDHPITARAIGEQLGICLPGDPILTGKEIDKLPLERLAELVQETTIFARVTPEHKLRIVEAFQRSGQVVAMTGDGVNDAPAIRKADVGIAMGSQGTDLTKDTAGIVLMEDHFHSIIDGVKEGRKIIGNIRKSIGCLISGNLAEVLVATTAVVIGLPMPFIPLQILLMNLLTDALPAIVLATDSGASGSQERHQDVIDRSLYRTVLTRGSILGFSALGVFIGALAMGAALPLAQTMTFATLVVGQLGQTVAWRRLGSTESYQLTSDRPLLSAIVFSWTALLAAIYLPSMQSIFATIPLRLPHWCAVLAVAGGVSKLSKTVLNRRPREQRMPATSITAVA